MRPLEPLVGALSSLDDPSLRNVREVFDVAAQGGLSPAKARLLRSVDRGAWDADVARDWTARLARARTEVRPAAPLDPQSSMPEDLSARSRTMIVPVEVEADWHAADLIPLARRYGMRMLLQLEPHVSVEKLANGLAADSGLSLQEIDATVDMVRSRGAISSWGEDRMMVTGSRRPTFLVPSTVAWPVRNRAKRYASRDSSHAIDHQFHGRVALRKEQHHTRGLAKILGRDARTMRSHIEGGNLLSGTTSDGRGYALVGLDSLLISAFDLDRRRAFKEQEIVAVERKLAREGAFTEEAVRAVSSRLTLARTGKWLDPRSPSAAKAEDARRFMAVLELTKKVIADDLGLPVSRVVMLTQPGFHIDMHLRPLAPGEVLVHHPRTAIEMVERAIAAASGWEKRELLEMKAELVREEKQKGHLYDQIIRELKDAGLIAIPAPGVFKSKKRRANFMNAIPGSAPSDETFYITNGSSLGTLLEEAERFFRGLGVDNVHFVGAQGGGERKLCRAEQSLALEGGLDCREVHHAGVDRADEDLLHRFVAREQRR